MTFELPASPGTVSLAVGATTLTGTGTALSLLNPGDKIEFFDGTHAIIKTAPDSDTAAEVVGPWTGTAKMDVGYQITPRDFGGNAALETRLLNEMARASDVAGVAAAWQFSTLTGAGDPGDGYLRFDNSDPTATTEIYISSADARGNALAAWLASLLGGQISFRAARRPNAVTIFSVGAITDHATYKTVAVTFMAPAGATAFLANEDLIVGGSSSGPEGVAGLTWYQGAGAPGAGLGVDGDQYFRTDTKQIYAKSGGVWALTATITDGVTIGHRLQFSNSLADSDPGAGKFKANSATFGSITKLWIDNDDLDALDITAWLDGMDDVANGNARGYLTLQGEFDPAVKAEFAIVGATTDKTGYRELTVSPISGIVPANGAVLAANFAKSGADGAGTGDFKADGTVPMNGSLNFAGNALVNLGSLDGTPLTSFYKRSNVLGVVAQSAGVPTGALIESGSNANGTYVRFANGLQICRSPVITVDVTTATGAVFTSASEYNWTLPAAFFDNNYHVVGGGRGNSQSHMMVGRPNTASLASLTGVGWTSLAGRPLLAVAIGRWF